MKKIHSLGTLAALMALSSCTPCYDGCDPCGEVTYIHKYGVQVDPEYWNVTGQSGEVIKVHLDGTTEKRTYQNGSLHGRSTVTYPFSEQIQTIEDYDSNTCIRRQTFLECGSPECSIEYPAEGCVKYTYWYNCGTPRCIEKYNRNVLVEAEYFDQQNNLESSIHQGNGERVHRDRFGQFLHLDTFENGFLCKRTYYHPNGTIHKVCPYDRQGNICGIVRTYQPDGSPETVETWEGDLQHGITVTYKNGEKYCETPYVAGKKHGLERRYLRGETITQEVSWYENYVHGPCYTYLGDTVQTDWYYRGKVTTRSNYDSYNTSRIPMN